MVKDKPSKGTTKERKAVKRLNVREIGLKVKEKRRAFARPKSQEKPEAKKKVVTARADAEGGGAILISNAEKKRSGCYN